MPDSPLLPGRYQVATNLVRPGDDEGPLSPWRTFVLETPGRIELALPPPWRDCSLNVWCSGPDGGVLRLYACVPSSQATLLIDHLPTGREAPQRVEAPLPPGELFMSGARLCSFAGNMVYVGLPYRPGYYLPAEGFIPFPAPVSVAIEYAGGTYIVADKTYWLPGDLGTLAEQLTVVLPYGAVPGTAIALPGDRGVAWFGARGPVLAQGGTELAAVVADKHDFNPLPARGYSVILDDGEVRRLVSCGWCVNLANLALTRFDWEFNSASGGYGLAADGLYRLEGEGAVDARIDFGKIDFGAEELKHLPAAYLGVDAEQPMRLSVRLPDGQEYDYAARSAGPDLQMQRIDPGKGLRANWYGLALANQDGSDFRLARLSFAPAASPRRI